MYTSVREEGACAIKGTHDLWPCIWNHKGKCFWWVHGSFQLHTQTFLCSRNHVGVGAIRRFVTKPRWRHPGRV